MLPTHPCPSLPPGDHILELPTNNNLPNGVGGGEAARRPEVEPLYQLVPDRLWWRVAYYSRETLRTHEQVGSSFAHCTYIADKWHVEVRGVGYWGLLGCYSLHAGLS